MQLNNKLNTNCNNVNRYEKVFSEARITFLWPATAVTVIMHCLETCFTATATATVTATKYNISNHMHKHVGR